MRKVLIALLLLCGSYQGWQMHLTATLAAEAEAQAEETGVVPVAEVPPTALERLGSLVGEEPPPEVEPVSMVHCVIDEVGSFVRRTECLDRGGAIDEPSWAQSEG